MSMIPACTRSASSQSNEIRSSPRSPSRAKRLSQVKRDTGNRPKSLEQPRSEVFFSKTLMPARGTKNNQLQSFMPDSANLGMPASAASACESRTDGEMATCFRRLFALEAKCEELQHTLQDRLEQFHGELEDKLNQLTRRIFATRRQNCDAAIPLDATNQESPIGSSGDLSQTVASVYGMLRTEMMQEVGQLRSFLEREVQSLCSQFEMQSERMEQNVVVASKSEATNNWLSQRMAEVGQDVTKLREREIFSRSEVGELRSRLEVVVRKREERTKQVRWADETEASRSSLNQENGLSERVQKLEKACQQAVAMPAAAVLAAESLRAELRQAVGNLRQDVDYLKRTNYLQLAIAGSQRHDKAFGDQAAPKDPAQRSPHEGTSPHQRFSDFEAAYAVESQLVWHVVEILKECVGVQDHRTNNLTDSAAHACASNIMKAQAPLSNELVMSRISVLESMMTSHLGSSKTFEAQTQVQGQEHMTVQAKSALSSESHPALEHTTSPLDMKATRTSVPLHTDSGISSSPKDVGSVLIWDGGSRTNQKATHTYQSPRSAEIPSHKLGLDLRLSAFNGLAGLHSVKEIPSSSRSTALSSAASGISSDMLTPRLQSALMS